MVSFPMPQLVFPSPTAGSRPRRLTIGLQDMLVPFPDAGKKSGYGPGGPVRIGTVEAGRQGATARGFAPRRTVVLVGLMGAGKSKIGQRLAARLLLPFFDSDDEIEAAAGETIEEIFANRGERVFRDGERRVIARLLAGPVHVLATGGGAFMDPATRRVIGRSGVSLWLRADLDVLASRVSRRSNRPLLKTGDTRAILADLITRRYPIYAEANVIIDSGEGSPELTVNRAIAALACCPLAAVPPEAEGEE
jgi:shikimate kinase